VTLQYGTVLRNAQLDAIETTVGTSPIMRIRSGAPPANCAAADTGTVGATLTLPSDWMAAASGGSKGLAGTWQDASADASITVGHFRIYNSGDTVVHMQGTCSTTGDLDTDSDTLTAGQSFTVNTFTITAGNA
jgi:hypothetical protein